MADYSTAASNATTALNNSTDGGFVEEYEVKDDGRRVRRGSLLDQVKAAAMLNALSNRKLHQLPKLRERK